MKLLARICPLQSGKIISAAKMSVGPESFTLQSKFTEFEAELTEHMNNVKLRMEDYAKSLLSRRTENVTSSAYSTLQNIYESILFTVQIMLVHVSNLNVLSLFGCLLLLLMMACFLSNGYPDCSNQSNSVWCLITTETKIDPFP